MSPLDLATGYIKRGYAPVPVPFKEKGPKVEGWGRLRITEQTVPQYFNGKPQNVGVILGEASDGLTDIDLDCAAALALAPYFLPRTKSVFGRASKPASHWLYRTALYETRPVANIPFVSPVTVNGKKETLLEVRIGGGDRAAQTVFPGSTHVSGEAIVWERGAEHATPAEVDGEYLILCVHKLAAAVLIVRQWGEGSRQNMSLLLGGVLAREGWKVADIKLFVEAVARTAGDDDVASRVKAASDAAEEYTKNGKACGLPKLVETFGEQIAKKFAHWIGLKDGGPIVDRRPATPDGAENAALLEAMNAKFCVVNDGGRAMTLWFEEDGGREIPVFQSFADFRNYHNNEKVRVDGRNVGKGTWWTGHAQRRSYKALVFDPTKPREFAGKLNLWRGFGVEPVAGDWSLMQRHILDVLASGDPGHADYITRWAAWAVQHPAEQAEVALVFRGGKGSGKGVFGRALCRLFGQHGLQISTSSHLVGKFNAHIRECCLLFADEAWWAGDKASEGALKRLITEDTLAIEPKGRDAITVPNRLHVIMASNSEWVVPASDDERRISL